MAGKVKRKSGKMTEPTEKTESWGCLEQNFIMDPEGDTIITLNFPGGPFAVVRGPDVADAAQQDSASESKESAPQTFLVSSRHLILASLVFKKMLTGPGAGAGWSEAKKVDGQFKIDAYEWDPQALAIVLDLVHGRHRRTPKSVSLESLSNIAAIVDYYEFHEAVEVTCRSWVSTLRVSEPIPAKPERKLFLWMFNAWVFGLEDIFTTTTKAAILQTTSVLEAPDNLPIPEKVIDRMNENRQTIVDAIVAGLASLLEDYAKDRKGCNWSCACVHLGALTKHSVQMKFAENPPCSGKSLAEMVYSLRDMKRPDWTSVEEGTRGNYYHGQYGAWHKCPSNNAKANAFDHTQLSNTNIRVVSLSVGAFDLGLSGDLDTSKESQKEAAKQKWESSPVLLKSLASIINKNRSKMMGMSLRDFVCATGADRA